MIGRERINRIGKKTGTGRAVRVLLGAVMVLMIVGCGDAGNLDRQANRTTGKSAGVADALQAGMEKNESTPSEVLPVPEKTAGQIECSAADVDLTILSATMVYSEVYNMMMKPEEYLGKAIRMRGQYSVYHDDESGMDYTACIIQDATACCAQGMEFVLKEDEYSYPADYPVEGQEVTVQGVYATYMEGDITYCTLRDAVWLEAAAK